MVFKRIRDSDKFEYINQVKMIYQIDAEPPLQYRDDINNKQNNALNTTRASSLAPQTRTTSLERSPAPSSDLSTLTNSYHSVGYNQTDQINSKQQTNGRLKCATVAPHYRHSSSSIDHKTLQLSRPIYLKQSPSMLQIESNMNSKKWSPPISNSAKTRPRACICPDPNGLSGASWSSQKAVEFGLERNPRQNPNRLTSAIERLMTHPTPLPPRPPGSDRRVAQFLTNNLQSTESPLSRQQASLNNNSNGSPLDEVSRRQQSMADGSLDNIQMIVDEENSVGSSFGLVNGDTKRPVDRKQQESLPPNKSYHFNYGMTCDKTIKRVPMMSDKCESILITVPNFCNDKSQKVDSIQGKSGNANNGGPEGSPPNSSNNNSNNNNNGSNEAGFLRDVEHVVHFDDLDHINGYSQTNSDLNQTEGITTSTHTRALGRVAAQTNRDQSAQTGSSNVRFVYESYRKYKDFFI